MSSTASSVQPAWIAATPLSDAESLAVRITITAVVGFGVYGLATSASSTIGYLISVAVVGAVIARFRTAPLPAPLALALAVAAVVHLAGGLVSVGNDVLYNGSIGPSFHSLQTHPLQYDHFAHTYATFVATLTIWTLLARPSQSDADRRELIALCFLAGIGVGGLNEMIEFLITIAHHNAHVGGYSNTGWDLVVNTVGALGAVAVIRTNQLDPVGGS